MQLEVFILPPGWDAGPSQSHPPALTLCTWVEEGSVRVKVYMTDFFLFARLNLPNVLISVAKMFLT